MRQREPSFQQDVLGTLAVACPPAVAQLPSLTDPVTLPLQDGAVGEVLPGDAVEDVVEEVVNEPLPEPVEQVVRDSPVAPIRDEVRRLVNETTGTGGGSGGGGSGGGGSTGNGSSSGGGGSSPGGTTGSGGTSGGQNGSGDSTSPR